MHEQDKAGHGTRGGNRRRGSPRGGPRGRRHEERRCERRQVLLTTEPSVPPWGEASTGPPAASTTTASPRTTLLFDSGAAAPNVDFTRRFSAGTFAYHCRKHGAQGMRGTVRVAPQVVTAPRRPGVHGQVGGAGTHTGTSFDVKYRVGSGAWKTWRNNTRANSMVFGKGGPVAVARGKSYSFQVRSGSGAGESGFSPVKSFRAG